LFRSTDHRPAVDERLELRGRAQVVEELATVALGLEAQDSAKQTRLRTRRGARIDGPVILHRLPDGRPNVITCYYVSTRIAARSKGKSLPKRSSKGIAALGRAAASSDADPRRHSRAELPRPDGLRAGRREIRRPHARLETLRRRPFDRGRRVLPAERMPQQHRRAENRAA